MANWQYFTLSKQVGGTWGLNPDDDDLKDAINERPGDTGHALNMCGSRGWELVNADPSSKTYYFKKVAPELALSTTTMEEAGSQQA
jgi:hypothetical protein